MMGVSDEVGDEERGGGEGRPRSSLYTLPSRPVVFTRLMTFVVTGEVVVVTDEQTKVPLHQVCQNGEEE